MVIKRTGLHQATQYLKQLKIQLIGELPHEGQYALHFINDSISTGILNNSTEIKIDLPSHTFLYYHDERGHKVNLDEQHTAAEIHEIVVNMGLKPPDNEFPDIAAEEYPSFLEYARSASSLLEEYRLTLEGQYTFTHLWGHNFDFSVVQYFEAGQIGVGISPGDKHSEEPYLYITPWPFDEELLDRELPCGQWWTVEWEGILVPWEELVNDDHRLQTVLDLYHVVTEE